MGIVEEVGSEVTGLAAGDRVVIPFQISCGHCFMCDQALSAQCETTQVREQGMGAALFGYTKLYGEVPGGQAEYLRVPQAQYTHIKVPEGPPDERFVYLSDVLPTAWQAVEYADVPDGGSVVVLGLGPIGDMAARVAAHRGVERVIGVDLVPERLERAPRRGIEVVDLDEHDDDLGEVIRELTGGRGPDCGHRRRGHGGARLTGRAGRAADGRAAAGRARSAADGEGRHRPAAPPAPRDRHRAAGRHDLADRRVRRDGGPAADADAVRQADPAPHGPGQREALGRTTSCRC